MISPAHFFDTAFGGSAHGVAKGGLTAARPRAASARWRRAGVLVDVAHASARHDRRRAGAWPTRPVVASHTGVRGDRRQRPQPDRRRSCAGSPRPAGSSGIGFWDTACGGDDAAAIARVDRLRRRASSAPSTSGSARTGTARCRVPFDAAGLAGAHRRAARRGPRRRRRSGAVMGGNALRLFAATLPAAASARPRSRPAARSARPRGPPRRARPGARSTGRSISSAIAAAMTSGSATRRSPCTGRRRSARGGAGRGGSARSGCAAGSTGTAGGRPRAPSSSSGRPGRPRGRTRRGGGTGRGRRRGPRRPAGAPSDAGSIRGPGDRDHPQAVDPPRGRRVGRDDPPQQRLADARPADRHDDDPLVRPVAELAPELLAAPRSSGAGSNPVT